MVYVRHPLCRPTAGSRESQVTCNEPHLMFTVLSDSPQRLLEVQTRHCEKRPADENKELEGVYWSLGRLSCCSKYIYQLICFS